MAKIKVKITQSSGWYRKGDVHEVNNYICFNWGEEKPYFERSKGMYGINCAHCEVMPKGDIPEYTMDELFENVGHEFKIKGA